MFELFYKLKEFWNEYNFEIVICLLLLFFLIGALYQKITGKKGTWSNSYFYDNMKNYDKKYYDYDDKSKRKSGGGGDSKGETECRRVLQSVFGRPFNKIRPNFLSNPVTDGGYNLEIDCYDHDLRLGIEYHGKQHYEYVPYFHKNKEAFYNQKYRDELKKRMCKDNGIVLIEVPYTVKEYEIEDFLIKQLKKYQYLK
jgi:hypothetical protein